MQCLKCGNDFDDLYECPLCAEVWRKSGRFNKVFTKIEDYLIALLLGVMVLMVLVQILMRNLYQSGIAGGDDLVRHLVLWIAFLGAGIATRSNSHVKIDVITNFLRKDAQKYLDVVVSLFSSVVCTILMVSSCQFVYIEFQVQGHSQFLNIPIWAFEMIMPLGYLIITIRFAYNFLAGFRDIYREKIH